MSHFSFIIYHPRSPHSPHPPQLHHISIYSSVPFLYLFPLLGVFVKLRKGNKALFLYICPSSRPSTLKSSPPTGLFSTNLMVIFFSEYVLTNFKFINIWHKTDNFRKCPCEIQHSPLMISSSKKKLFGRNSLKNSNTFCVFIIFFSKIIAFRT